MPIFTARMQVRTEDFADIRHITMGTWQQLLLIDFDNRPRDRRIVFQLLGEWLAG